MSSICLVCWTVGVSEFRWTPKMRAIVARENNERHCASREIIVRCVEGFRHFLVGSCAVLGPTLPDLLKEATFDSDCLETFCFSSTFHVYFVYSLPLLSECVHGCRCLWGLNSSTCKKIIHVVERRGRIICIIIDYLVRAQLDIIKTQWENWIANVSLHFRSIF